MKIKGTPIFASSADARFSVMPKVDTPLSKKNPLVNCIRLRVKAYYKLCIPKTSGPSNHILTKELMTRRIAEPAKRRAICQLTYLAKRSMSEPKISGSQARMTPIMTITYIKYMKQSIIMRASVMIKYTLKSIYSMVIFSETFLVAALSKAILSTILSSKTQVKMTVHKFSKEAPRRQRHFMTYFEYFLHLPHFIPGSISDSYELKSSSSSSSSSLSLATSIFASSPSPSAAYFS